LTPTFIARIGLLGATAPSAVEGSLKRSDGIVASKNQVVNSVFMVRLCGMGQTGSCQIAAINFATGRSNAFGLHGAHATKLRARTF
jgi:hypothetical protein